MYDIRNGKRIIKIITLLSILIILLSTHIVYAKYITIDKISGKFAVASPIFIVEGKEKTKISEINNIGYYEFIIKNYNETNISETSFWYTIEILSNTDESIQFELYNKDKQIPLKNLKTEQLSIIGNEKIEEKYKLKVIYDSQKATVGKNILEEVQIKVHSEQETI